MGITPAERGIVGMRGRRRGSLVDPRVEHVDEAVHHFRDVDVLQVAALHGVGQRLATRVARSAHFVHAVVADALVAEDTRIVPLVLQVAGRHPCRVLRRPDVVVHLVRDVDLRDEGGFLRGRREQHVLAVLHHDGIPRAGRGVVQQEAVEEALAVARDVEAGRVVDAVADARAR